MVALANLPAKVRISIGTAIVLGLAHGRLDAPPTTAYLMTYWEGKCTANCGFCPQARESRSRVDLLSRVMWPTYQIVEVVEALKRAVEGSIIRRVCIQAINYPGVFSHLEALVKSILKEVDVPISVSCQPLSGENIRMLAEAGIDRIGIPIDAAAEEVFDRVKGAGAGGPYRMERELALLREAVEIFGVGRVSTHLIVGLGETERNLVEIIQKCVDMGVLPALFAFTPVAGTAMEDRPQPSIAKYRRMQLARYLIVQGICRFEDMRFDEDGCLLHFGVDGQKLRGIILSGKPFLTSGCPGCNRPFYNEKPRGPIYNYPRELTMEEILKAAVELNEV